MMCEIFLCEVLIQTYPNLPKHKWHVVQWDSLCNVQLGILLVEQHQSHRESNTRHEGELYREYNIIHVYDGTP